MEDLLQFLYLMPVGVIRFQAAGSVEMMNPIAAACLLSLSSADTLQDIYSSLASIAPELQQLVTHFDEPAGPVFEEQRLRTHAGTDALVLSLTVTKIKDNVFMAVIADVTILAKQEDKLYVDRQKFFAIFDHVRDYAIYTITIDGHIEEWNQSLQRYAGWLESDVTGRNMSIFFPTDDPGRPSVDLLLAEAKRIGSTETEGWRLKRDGSRLWANSVITALPDETGTLRGFVVVSRDITERKRADDDLKQLASVDPLTGAYNRRHGDAMLAIEFAKRVRDRRPFAALTLDVDHFKSVNDRFGHAAGDAALCAVVQICRNQLRSIDMVVRWGGEEFLLVLPGVGSDAAMAAAERLRAAIAATQVALPQGGTLSITASIGVAVVSETDSPRDLLNRSDVALYAAKEEGRNRVVLAPQPSSTPS
jgi:diguanylate cyclase (GGDEF)-like protein/PAS domain S-box-containing protein